MTYNKILHDLKVEELTDKYRQNGYEVKKEFKCNDVTFDLVAEKENERIAFEVKVGKDKLAHNVTIRKARTAAEDNGYKFILAIASPPQSNEIHFESFNISLRDYLNSHPIPGELDRLSSKTRIDDISDIDIGRIRILEGKFEIKGSAVFELDLEYDHESIASLDVPFKFEAILDKNLKIEKLNIFDIDTSDSYG